MYARLVLDHTTKTLPWRNTAPLKREVAMLCEELEKLEGEFDEIVTALEDPNLTDEQRGALEKVYSELSHTIKEHQTSGHKGGPCFEE